jgi:glycosyltransferase involved in cell wall biosynthesis
MAEKLVSDFGIPRERVSSIPLAAVPSFEPAPETREWDAVYAGSLQENRELGVLLRSWALVTAKESKARLLVLGVPSSPGDGARFDEEVNALGLASSVHRRSPVPRSEVAHWIRRAKIGLSVIPPRPYFLVSSPTKLFEYMAAGVPVVASSEIVEQREAVRTSGAGLLCRFDEVEISAAILRLLRDPTEVAIRGENGRAFVRDTRGFDHLARAADQCLRGLPRINA